MQDNIKKNNIKISDYDVKQPDEYKNKYYVFVEVNYLGDYANIPKILKMPVISDKENNWYVAQDGEIDSNKNNIVSSNDEVINNKIENEEVNEEVPLGKEIQEAIQLLKYDAEGEYFYFDNDRFDQLEHANKTIRNDYYKFTYQLSDGSDLDRLICVNKYTSEIVKKVLVNIEQDSYIYEYL